MASHKQPLKFGKKSALARDAQSWHRAEIEHQRLHSEAQNAHTMRKNLQRLQREIILDDRVQARRAALDRSPD